MRVTRAGGAYVALTHARQPEIVADSTCSQAARTMPQVAWIGTLFCYFGKFALRYVDSWYNK